MEAHDLSADALPSCIFDATVTAVPKAIRLSPHSYKGVGKAR